MSCTKKVVTWWETLATYSSDSLKAVTGEEGKSKEATILMHLVCSQLFACLCGKACKLFFIPEI